MIRYAKGDLFTSMDPMIVHGCNAQGVMGAGVAKIIAEAHPEVYTAYQHYLNNCRLNAINPLGTVHYARPWYRPVVFANAITQDKFGGATNRWVSYDAVDRCMLQIASDIADRKPDCSKISMPKIGAGLGGGDWGVIEAIIKHRLKDITVTVLEL